MSPYIIPGLKEKKSRNQIIIDVVCKYLKIPVSEVKTSNRKKEVVAARHMAMYVLSQNKDLSLHTISRELGLENHTTVIHGLKKVNGFIDIQDETTLKNIEGIKKLLMK